MSKKIKIDFTKATILAEFKFARDEFLNSIIAFARTGRHRSKLTRDMTEVEFLRFKIDEITKRVRIELERLQDE